MSTSLLVTLGCDGDEGRSEGPLGASGDDGKADIDEDPGVEVESFKVRPRVVAYSFDPDMPSYMGMKLSQSQGWNDPHSLAFQYRDAVREATWGAVDYDLQSFSRIKSFPQRTDGDRYDETSYLRCLNEGNCLTDSPYMTDLAYYSELLGWCDEADKGVEEIWVFGAPWFGMPESQMTGPGAYWLNSTPLQTACSKPLVIMAFSYHVPVSNMLHNLGHRIESHLSRAFGSWDTSKGVSPWDQFTRRAENGAEAECGNVHWPPNTLTEYAYWDTAEEVSGCDRWLDYPEHEEFEPEIVNCWTWGCAGDTQLNYMQWWIQHLPHREGTLEGFQTNWQRYIFDYRSFM